MARQNLLRRSKLILYKLTRLYGIPCTFYRSLATTVDLKVGSLVRTWDTYLFQRVILLPKKWTTDFEYDIGYLAANKNFTYGGLFDQTARLVIVEERQLPATLRNTEQVFRKQDNVVIDNLRFEINQIDDLDQNAGHILLVKAIPNAEVP